MKSLFLIFSLCLTLGLSAQINSLVYLKNGSAIRGEVVKNDSTCVSLRTRDGSYWNFSSEEVLRIEKYAADVKERGFYNRSSLGITGGASLGGSLRIVNGYAFNRHWEAGFGIGIEALTWNPYVPLFLEGRYNFLQGSSRPFISIHSGYLMPVRNHEFDKGGLTTGIDAGITHYFSNRVGISTSVGYRYSLVKTNNPWWDDFTTLTQMNRFEIRLGLVFR